MSMVEQVVYSLKQTALFPSRCLHSIDTCQVGKPDSLLCLGSKLHTVSHLSSLELKQLSS